MRTKRKPLSRKALAAAGAAKPLAIAKARNRMASSTGRDGRIIRSANRG